MVIKREKLERAIAEACMTSSEIVNSGVTRSTLFNASIGKSVRPVTVGKIARILNCDVADLIDEGVN